MNIPTLPPLPIVCRSLLLRWSSRSGSSESPGLGPASQLARTRVCVRSCSYRRLDLLRSCFAAICVRRFPSAPNDPLRSLASLWRFLVAVSLEPALLVLQMGRPFFKETLLGKSGAADVKAKCSSPVLTTSCVPAVCVCSRSYSRKLEMGAGGVGITCWPCC